MDTGDNSGTEDHRHHVEAAVEEVNMLRALCTARLMRGELRGADPFVWTDRVEHLNSLMKVLPHSAPDQVLALRKWARLANEDWLHGYGSGG